MTWLPRWLRGQPRFPLAIVGHGRVHHAHLPARSQRRLQQLAATTAPREWGVLFVHDVRQRRWTLYSPDPEYTAMFAPAAPGVELTFDVFAAKFPCWNDGWAIP